MGIYDKLKLGKPLTRKEAEIILKDLGYHFKHSRGSHHHWLRGSDIFTLPVHGKDLKKWVTRELRRLYEEKKGNKEN